MTKKARFKPVITRVKLNPEQAVLVCDCFNAGLKYTRGVSTAFGFTDYYGACFTPGGRVAYFTLACTGGGVFYNEASRNVTSS